MLIRDIEEMVNSARKDGFAALTKSNAIITHPAVILEYIERKEVVFWIHVRRKLFMGDMHDDVVMRYCNYKLKDVKQLTKQFNGYHQKSHKTWIDRLRTL